VYEDSLNNIWAKPQGQKDIIWEIQTYRSGGKTWRISNKKKTGKWSCL